MRKASFGFWGIVTIAAILSLSGCNTVEMSTNLVGWSDYAGIVVKDYEVVGIVTLDSTESIVKGPLHLTNSHTGSKITYADLIKEAKQIGAHDIINVRIDQYNESSTNLVSFFIGSKRTINYTASALAIKYKEGAASELSKVEQSSNILKTIKE